MNSFTLISAVIIVSLYTRNVIKRLLNARKLVLEGVKVSGVVVGHKSRLGRISAFHPLIQFTAFDGESVHGEGRSEIAFPMYSKGDRVTIYYEANNPKNFTLNSEFEQATPYIALFMIWVPIVILIGHYIADRV